LILDTPKIALHFWTKPIGACKNQLKLPQNCSKTIVKSLDFTHLKTAFHFWTKPIGAWKKSMKNNLKRLKILDTPSKITLKTRKNLYKFPSF
jgi:hypothetical protein